MARYIDTDIATKLMIQWADRETNDDIRHGYHNCQVIMYNMPTADVRENVKGEWIVDGQNVYCSHCKKESGYNWYGASAFSKFCPKCRAEMRGGDAE